MTDIPEDYSDINSGLGKAKPKCVLILPIKDSNHVYGVIEVASFEELKDYEISFVETIAEDISATIASIRVNEETKRLLKESQKVTKQLREQEDLMRQNFEELMASQEEMRRRQDQIELLLKGENILKDMTKEQPFVDFNSSTEELLNKKVKEAIVRQKELLEEVLGKNMENEQKVKKQIEKMERKPL